MNFDSVYNGLLRAESRSLQKAFLLFTKNGRVVGAPTIQLFGLVFFGSESFHPPLSTGWEEPQLTEIWEWEVWKAFHPLFCFG